MTVSFTEYCKLVRMFLQAEPDIIPNCDSASYGLSEELSDADEACPYYEELICVPNAVHIVELIIDTEGHCWQRILTLYNRLSVVLGTPADINHIDDVITILEKAGRLLVGVNDCIKYIPMEGQDNDGA